MRPFTLYRYRQRITTKKWPFYMEKGVLSHSRDHNIIGLCSLRAFITPEEVGEYSMFVKYDFSKYKVIRIFNVENPANSFGEYDMFETKEILTTSEGSVLYFNEKISDSVIAGNTYPARVYYDYRGKGGLYTSPHERL